jgi:hypothetical protein
MRLTIHSKQRIKERAGVRYQKRNKLFREALLNGISPGNTSNLKLKGYLLSKQHNCKAKYYKGYVFIYSKNGKLYTMYEAPNSIKESQDQKCKMK